MLTATPLHEVDGYLFTWLLRSIPLLNVVKACSCTVSEKLAVNFWESLSFPDFGNSVICFRVMRRVTVWHVKSWLSHLRQKESNVSAEITTHCVPRSFGLLVWVSEYPTPFWNIRTLAAHNTTRAELHLAWYVWWWRCSSVWQWSPVKQIPLVRHVRKASYDGTILHLDWMLCYQHYLLVPIPPLNLATPTRRCPTCTVF